ncbi:MAG: hypothetical protein ACRDH2_02535 [Anaerolineales bacterium]
MIPHGIPDIPFIDPSFHKDLFGVEGKTVLLSFGLLSPNKGIENVISAADIYITPYLDHCPGYRQRARLSGVARRAQIGSARPACQFCFGSSLSNSS